MEHKNELIQKTVDYIESHLDQKLSLDEIAEHTGYSKFHLNRMFTDSTGCTLHKYIQNRRLEMAEKRLTNTNDSIADIACDAGYESQQSFTYAFKQIYLNPPQIYRKLYTKSHKKNTLRMEAMAA